MEVTAILGRVGIGGVDVIIYIPGGWPSKSVGLQRGDIDAQGFLGHYVGVWWQIGKRTHPKEAVTPTGRCGERWLPLPCWIALAKEQLHKLGDVRIHGCDSLSHVLFIVTHVIPLTGSKRFFRVQLAIDQG